MRALRNPNDRFWRKRSPLNRARGDLAPARVLKCIAFAGRRGPFLNLVRAGFYDDSRFYRVTARFAQFGIPGNPAVAALWRTPALPDDPVRESNTRGRFAFAMTGPNTRTTQIYICKTDMSSQDKDGFAPLGTVAEGMDVVDTLYAGYAESAGGGMRGGKQDRIFAEGNTHLDRDFPKLDRLIRARVE
jgi:homoserine O-acetyltransferase